MAPSRRDAARSGPGRAGRGLAVLWTVAAPGSDFAVAVLPPVCAFLLWRGVVRVERRVRAGGEESV
ncbi:MAG: hypothetical protein KA259_03840 [Caldilineaceae bacterium]|nr:hypothetical protein [Caldilineaceae bacterium]